MADKSISELLAASQITQTDLFVLEQNGTAKKLTGQVLLNWLTAAADGHGGISSIEKKSTSGLVDTYRITLADTTTFDFKVTNGKAISSFTKVSTSGLKDTWRMRYNDGSYTDVPVTNGAKGDKGDNATIYIRYASQKPTAQSHDMGELPDDWMGIYAGYAETAPTDWQEYNWYQIKGIQGDTGKASEIESTEVRYMASKNGTIVPSGSWQSTVPNVPQGQYLWCRTVVKFNSGDPITSYSVSRMGLDGTGSVKTVNGLSPDEDGNIQIQSEDVGAVATTGGTMSGALDMGSNKVSNLADPTEDADAVPLSKVKAMLESQRKQNLLDNHPILSWYESDDPTSPAELFGGSWTQDTSGRVLVSAGGDYAVEAEFGNKEITQTAEQVGSHIHTLYGNVVGHDSSSGTTARVYGSAMTYGTPSGTAIRYPNNSDKTKANSTTQAMDIRQPSRATYRWQRVA